MKQGGLYINDTRAADERGRVTLADALAAQVIVLRKGPGSGGSIRVGG